MKLLPLQITSHHSFRDRLRGILRHKIESLHFRSSNPNSIDGEERICDIKFLSAPHVYSTTDLDESVAQINGDINVAIELQTMLEEGEEMIEEKLFSLKYSVDCELMPVHRNDLEKYISTSKMTVRSHQLS